VVAMASISPDGWSGASLLYISSPLVKRLDKS
jgi:hypothetical protein